uniref:Uncharacterized protein n=1 Tax=Arundo donax TaxID=35708 RepID=A0A0A9EXU6_ARUDO
MRRASQYLWDALGMLLIYCWAKRTMEC